MTAVSVPEILAPANNIQCRRKSHYPLTSFDAAVTPTAVFLVKSK
jgi:hypothetical protein